MQIAVGPLRHWRMAGLRFVRQIIR